MSISVMSYVWENAPHSGGDLLVLLAMADWADDKGASIWPALSTLAAKARLKERETRYVLRRLELAGAIVARPKPGYPTHYAVVVPWCEPEEALRAELGRKAKIVIMRAPRRTVGGPMRRIVEKGGQKLPPLNPASGKNTGKTG